MSADPGSNLEDLSLEDRLNLNLARFNAMDDFLNKVYGLNQTLEKSKFSKTLDIRKTKLDQLETKFISAKNNGELSKRETEFIESEIAILKKELEEK